MAAWEAISPEVNGSLAALSVPRLSEQDAFLLYLMVLLLYEEGVEPSRAELLFKLKEHNASDALLTHAMTYYSVTRQLYRVEKPGAEGSIECVYLKQEPRWFRGWVDLKSPDNKYPPHVWVDFLEHLITIYRSADHLAFSHTRYALAKELKKNGPMALQRIRLGDIAHLIQLALQQEYLCYETTIIRPAWTSMAALADKEYKTLFNYEDALLSLSHDVRARYECKGALETASTTDESATFWWEEPSGPPAPSAPQISRDCQDELEHLGRCLGELLADHDRILLSQVRVMLSTRFQLTLKPMKYGYSKLSSLLADRFSHLCRLVRHRNRHVYLEAGVSVNLPSHARPLPSLFGVAARATDRIPSIFNACHEPLDSLFFRVGPQPPNSPWTLRDFLIVPFTHPTDPFFQKTP